jgi:hypothetical protein
MRSCDRCGAVEHRAELYCTGCGNLPHGPCEYADQRYRIICERCWAILSHAHEWNICSSFCDCVERYGDAIAAAMGVDDV